MTDSEKRNAEIFIDRLKQSSDLEASKVFFNPEPGNMKTKDAYNLIRSPRRKKKEGEVEEVFKKMANYKLEQGFLIMESFTSFWLYVLESEKTL